jgi:predicted RNA-binding protein YlqC (UPF0109 family)
VKQFIEYCARQLVDHPEGVHVEQRESGDTVVLTLRVTPGDLGKVIGREGRTAHAMRTLLSAAATAKGLRATLEIAD